MHQGAGFATVLHVHVHVAAMTILLCLDEIVADSSDSMNITIRTANFTAWSPCSVCCTQYKDPMGIELATDIGLRPTGRQYRACMGGACPQVCEISLWSGWTDCTLSQPWRNRTRYFVHPSDEQQDVCGSVMTRELARCSDDQLTRTSCGIYHEWSPWDALCDCDSTTFQYQRRNRTCIFPLHLPPAVQIRPCITANNPDRVISSRCNKPLLYACYPVEDPQQWSAWDCDARCTTGASARGRARRNRLVGLFQQDSLEARQELAVCACPERHQTIDCEIPCSSRTTAPLSVQPATSVALSTTSTPATDSNGVSDSDSGSSDVDTDSADQTRILGILVALSTILVVLLATASFATLVIYRRYKRTRAEMTSLADESSRNSRGSTTPQQPGRAAAGEIVLESVMGNETGNDDAQTTDADGKLMAEVYINPHYRSPMRYPNYRDPYSESSSHHLSQLSESQQSEQAAAASGHLQFHRSSGGACSSSADDVPVWQSEDMASPHGQYIGNRHTRQPAGKPQRRRIIPRGHASRPPELGNVAASLDTAGPAQYVPEVAGVRGYQPGQDSATSYSMTSSADENTDHRGALQRFPRFPRFSNRRSTPPTGELAQRTDGQ